MTTDHQETESEYNRRIADDGAGGLASVSEIQDNISSAFDDLGTVYTSEASIPSSATHRPAGAFLSAYDAREYLEIGGLSATDNAGDVIPIGFVYFLREFDETLQEYLYTVYIDEDTN